MALRLALLFAVTSIAWILFSDRILSVIGFSVQVERVLSSLKGVAFILVTAVILYLLWRNGLRQVRDAHLAVRDQDRKVRQAYVDVLDAVTGGRLVIVSGEEMGRLLGDPLTEAVPLSSPVGLSDARETIRQAAAKAYPGWKPDHALSASGEAFNNVLKHAGGGTFQVLQRDGVLQVKCSDHGPGIDFRTLPKATLTPGFSTTQTLGMGFTIMLQLCDRVLICTEPGSTTVVLETHAAPAERTDEPAPVAEAPHEAPVESEKVLV